MELRDLLTTDISKLTPVQAEFFADDITATLIKGGLDGARRERLKTLLVEARRKALPPEQPDTRTRVAELIRQAEARGDKRTAQSLAKSMVDADVAAADNEARKKQAIDRSKKFREDSEAATKAEIDRQIRDRINGRTQELLYAHGNRYDYTEENARAQATQEVMGRRDFQYVEDADDEA